MSSRSLGLLDLPDDVLIYIVFFVTHWENQLPSKSLPSLLPTAQLKALALLHPRFLSPARAKLYRNPDLTRTPPNVFSDYSRSSSSGVRGSYRTLGPRIPEPPAQEIGPLQALAEALVLNPSLGSYVKSFERLGMHAQVLGRTLISPLAVSNALVTILERTDSLTELDFFQVDHRDIERMIGAICSIKTLKVLRLGGNGCTRTTDQSCYNFHEGDLRRIAKECTELEALYITTENVGFGDQGYVESFAFKRLKILHLIHATSLTNHHLRAILAQATGLTELIIRRSAVIEATTKERLTTSGIAAVLEMRGATLKKLVVDIAPRCYNAENDYQSSGTTPAVEAALANCSQLTDLTLLGPGLVNSTALHRLGSPLPTTTTHSFGMPAYTPKQKHPGLAYLERLFLGVYPPSYDGLLKLLESVNPGEDTPFTSLSEIRLTYPPLDCSGFVEASDKVTQLKSTLQVDQTTGRAIELILISPPYEEGKAWARGEEVGSATIARNVVRRQSTVPMVGMPFGAAVQRRIQTFTNPANPMVSLGFPAILTTTPTTITPSTAQPTASTSALPLTTTDANTNSAIIADIDSTDEEGGDVEEGGGRYGARMLVFDWDD